MNRSSSVARFPTGAILLRGNARPSACLGTKLHGEIMVAFELACENQEFDVGKELLDTFEQMTVRRSVPFSEAERSRLLEWLVGSQFRLLELRTRK